MSNRQEQRIRKGLSTLYHAGKLRVGKSKRDGWLQVKPGESSPRSHLTVYLNPSTSNWESPLLDEGQEGWVPMCRFLGLEMEEALSIWL